jgi:hypothetical protein
MRLSFLILLAGVGLGLANAVYFGRSFWSDGTAVPAAPPGMVW